MVLTVKAYDVFGPQFPQDLNLFVKDLSASGKIHAERLVFNMVPAAANAQREAPTRKTTDICRLPCDERDLPLWQDDDAGDEFDLFCNARKISEESQGILIRNILIKSRVRQRQWRIAVFLNSTKNMIVHQEMMKIQTFGFQAESPNSIGITPQLKSWI
ncbi:hypothetical protein GCM10011614_35620 [Novosphingobium colocasiae]|uniref:Uncharacterized protein n=1 Tax=Novosphingobium colocasiae TaxID=1256513 RepID=A0A918PPI5_9SPHN|nr:hypothetical protein GCM10011614_35620 [Novosphingobium colocasiae]